MTEGTVPLRVVVVDDEWAAREELRFLLAEIDGVEVVGEAADGAAAMEIIARLDPDVAVLDVRMPPPDGLDVARWLREVSPRTRVIFATAHDEHAVAAFDVRAADYVLKPFDPARVRRAVARARELVAESGVPHTGAEAGEPRETPGAAGLRAHRLVVERRRRTYLVDPVDVLYIGTDAGVVTVVTDDGTHYGCSETLRDIETVLAPEGFFRCHREYIVNLERVRALSPAASGTWRLLLTDPRRTELPVARNRVRGLRRVLGL